MDMHRLCFITIPTENWTSLLSSLRFGFACVWNFMGEHKKFFKSFFYYIDQ